MRAVFIVLALTLVACAAPKTEMVACPPAGCPKTEQDPDDPVRKRAAFDLQCAADKIEIVEIDFTTRGARGCGHQATYKRLHGFYEDWVMDAASVTSPAAAAAAAAAAPAAAAAAPAPAPASP